MNICLIDYENIHTPAFAGLDDLSPDDEVVVFFTNNSNNLTFDLMQKLTSAKVKITYKKVTCGVRNSLDFQLCSYLGYLIGTHSDGRFVIVSNDKGYSTMLSLWEGGVNGNVVVCAPNIRLGLRAADAKLSPAEAEADAAETAAETAPAAAEPAPPAEAAEQPAERPKKRAGTSKRGGRRSAKAEKPAESAAVEVKAENSEAVTSKAVASEAVASEAVASEAFASAEIPANATPAAEAAPEAAPKPRRRRSYTRRAKAAEQQPA